MWYYKPNNVAPAVFAALFLASGVVHFWQNFRYKAWKTTPLMPWAALLMTVGFVMREVGAFQYKNVGILIASIVLLFSGPPVYAAINYIIFCRCLYYVPFMSPIHPLRVFVTFLGIDIVIEILIGQGASRLANTSASPHFRQVGEDLVKVALILQAVLFVVFILIGVRFQQACRKQGIHKPNLNTVLYVMYTSCALITARCVYRIVEFFMGYDGEIYDTEWYFWVFEATLMFINTVLINVFHPGRYLPSSPRLFLGRDGVEREGPGWQDNRPFLVKFCDPIDIWGLIKGRDKSTRFWDWEPDQLEAYVAKQRQEKAAKKQRSQARWSWLKSKRGDANAFEAEADTCKPDDTRSKRGDVHDSVEYV